MYIQVNQVKLSRFVDIIPAYYLNSDDLHTFSS
jgi:hypothetical protein